MSLENREGVPKYNYRAPVEKEPCIDCSNAISIDIDPEKIEEAMNHFKSFHSKSYMNFPDNIEASFTSENCFFCKHDRYKKTVPKYYNIWSYSVPGNSLFPEDHDLLATLNLDETPPAEKVDDLGLRVLRSLGDVQVEDGNSSDFIQDVEDGQHGFFEDYVLPHLKSSDNEDSNENVELPDAPLPEIIRQIQEEESDEYDSDPEFDDDEDSHTESGVDSLSNTMEEEEDNIAQVEEYEEAAAILAVQNALDENRIQPLRVEEEPIAFESSGESVQEEDDDEEEYDDDEEEEHLYRSRFNPYYQYEDDSYYSNASASGSQEVDPVMYELRRRQMARAEPTIKREAGSIIANFLRQAIRDSHLDVRQTFRASGCSSFAITQDGPNYPFGFDPTIFERLPNQIGGFSRPERPQEPEGQNLLEQIAIARANYDSDNGRVIHGFLEQHQLSQALSEQMQYRMLSSMHT